MPKVNYLRVIVTERCNLQCYYCHREGEAKGSEEGLSKDELLDFIKMFHDFGITKIKLMGGEPTLRKDLFEIIKGIRSLGHELDISMISNGINIIQFVERYVDAGLDRINISIHKWSALNSCEMSNSNRLRMTKKTILKLNEMGVLTKLNYVLRKGRNEKELLNLIDWIGKYNLKLDILNVLYSQDQENLKAERYEFYEIENIISNNFSIKKSIVKIPEIGLPSTLIFLENGAIINLKNYGLNQFKPYKDCERCKYIEYCIEGIFAIRLTTAGLVKPCLFRKDNAFNLKKMSSQYDKKTVYSLLTSYLDSL